MRPLFPKSCSPRISHRLAQGVLFGSVLVLSTMADANIDSPATVRHVAKMLSRGVVALFPAIQGFAAKIACDAIMTVGSRFVEEAGLGKLQIDN